MSNLIELHNISKEYPQQRGKNQLVLNELSLQLKPYEWVALLGKSGSGKSSLLRVMAGLIPTSKGLVHYRGQTVSGPIKGMSMVFQDFALMPWLSVFDNVLLGLSALPLSAQDKREQALKAIDRVGLDGFESAYPKELSGGMRQRVGFARALAADPEVLLMDEAFSALDVLTAENLRADLLDLWQEKKTRLKSIFMVTHNIEEAVALADRIIVLGLNPSHIHTDMPVNLPHPRRDQSPEFRKVVDHIYQAITESSYDNRPEDQKQFKVIGLYYRLPIAPVSTIGGLIELLSAPEYQPNVDLASVSEEMHLEIDELFPVVEAVEILRLATVQDGRIALTQMGKKFIQADILKRKMMFANQLLDHVPLARHIRQMLDEQEQHSVPESDVMSVLKPVLSEDEANETLKTVIDWGRYAEIFAYHADTQLLSLENPE
jgi:NitT/TauT family transport system ATP-binding protein